MTDLLPLFLNAHGSDVLLVGGGPVATAKLRQLLAVGARVRIVSPEVSAEMAELVVRAAQSMRRRTVVWRCGRSSLPISTSVWLVVAAATPAVNQAVAMLAEARRIFVNAVDDPANATAFLSGVVRRDGVTVAISTSGAGAGADVAAARRRSTPCCRADLARVGVAGARRAHRLATRRRADGASASRCCSRR